MIEQVDYAGYDALKPYRNAHEDFYFPYTPYWHGMAAVYKATEILLAEGLENSFHRHVAVAKACRTGLAALGLSLYPDKGAIPSPTVTAVVVPEKFTWEQLDRRFRQRGLVVGGNYGQLSGKVFRIGHMGSQADPGLIQQALDVIAEIL